MYNIRYQGCCTANKSSSPQLQPISVKCLLLQQVIGYDMDYTCVNYSVEAWEGRAYSYGMQVRAPGCLTQTPVQLLVGLAPFACLTMKTLAELHICTPSRMPVCLARMHVCRCLYLSIVAAYVKLCVVSDSGCGRRGARWRGCTLTQSWSHAA